MPRPEDHTGQPAAAAHSPRGPRPGFDDHAARFALTSLPGPYLPWGAGTMRAAGLVAVCNDVVLKQRRHIVELGSGVSTVLLARLLTQQEIPDGFRLVAVEHDPSWAGWVRGQLEREGLGEHVTVVHAPLVPHPLAAPGLAWYDQITLDQGLDEALNGAAVELLLVDGPPAWAEGHGLARYPALPALQGRLAPGAGIVLDDLERPGEQEVVRRWQLESGLWFRHDEQRTGLATATTSTAATSG